jgi:tetratricopeptide (TPR) repeat protein
MKHEQAEDYRAAATAYEEVLAKQPLNLPALLGLERSFASMGLTDSLLPVLQRALVADPTNTTVRGIQLRSLHALANEPGVRAAFEDWVRAAPGDPGPYREYSRMLLQNGQTATADSVLRSGVEALGSAHGIELELAQLRAAMGLWVESARSWRFVIEESPYLEQAGVFSLTQAPAELRDTIRAALLERPIAVGGRRLAAALSLEWGRAREGWQALRVLSPDSAGRSAWLDYARRAESAQAWLVARDAVAAVFAVTHDPDHALRAATDAMEGGDSRSALALAGSVGATPGNAPALLPVRLRALASLGRAEEAEQLLERFHDRLPVGQYEPLLRVVALGWVRAGNLEHAKEMLARAGDLEDDPVGGWIALFEGDLETARRRLSPRAGEPTADLVSALALLSRTRQGKAPSVGAAYLALARADSAAAAAAFEQAAREVPDAASFLIAESARLYATLHDDVHAVPLWRELLEKYAAKPEAPEAELEWARALRRADDSGAAIAHLEHLILTYSGSALLPQARRELDLARASVPPTP